MGSLTGNLTSPTDTLRGRISSPGGMHGTLRGLEKINGFSAYQIAVFNGFEGTEEEWLASLKGEDGRRGTGVLKITTAPSSYTTTTGGYKPTYRVALSSVLSQALVSEVLVGDVISQSYYLYPVGYVDSNYVYLGARTSIRGATGTNGSNGKDGTGISSIVFKEQTDAGNVYTINLTDNTSYDITAPVGPEGSGGGSGGGSGENGGYYKPSVTQVNANTMQVSFSASKTGMPSVAAVNVTLPAGADGKDGNDGEDGYSPVREKDYWTAEDIAEIKSYVDDAILNGEW